MTEWSQVSWRKARRCDSATCVEQADLPPSLVFHKALSSGGNGNCVEVGLTERLSAIRDSKDPDGPVLVVPRSAFDALLGDAKRGLLDLT